MLKKDLYVMRSLSCGKKFTIQQYGALCHTANSVTNYFNKNVPDYIRMGNLSPNSCDLNLLDYAIWDIMKKILFKILKRYEDIEGLSAAMSYPWYRLRKKFINNSNDQWRIRIEKVVEEGGGHIVHLIRQHRLKIPRTFPYLLIYCSLIEKSIWLNDLKSPTCVSKPCTLQSVRICKFNSPLH